MYDDSSDQRRLEEKLDRIAGELRQIRYLMWFLAFVGGAVVISMLPQLLTNVLYVAILIAAVVGIWFLVSKVSQIPLVRRWRSRASSIVTPDRDGR